ncbi:oxoglutarate/iron-dependent dioxygenase [Tanacetum coccineum]
MQAIYRKPLEDTNHDMYKPNNMIPAIDSLPTKPFSLILPEKTTNSLSEIKMKKDNNLKSSCVVLRPGMVHLKNYISINDQVEIVKICQEFGMGPGGFYQPGFNSGAKLNLHMMCFGRNWDPQTKYAARYRCDGSQTPPVPDKLVSLVKTSIKDSQAHDDKIPSMHPHICIVNFYTTTGRLGMHQDRDESSNSLRKGLPVVSISVGDSARFLYGHNRDVRKANEVLLESGDVLIFGGKSRNAYHGVKVIIPNSAPLPLLQQSKLRPGRLNLTFRQF